MFGSDWPVAILAGDYARSGRRRTTPSTSLGVSDADRAAILGGNAAALYRSELPHEAIRPGHRPAARAVTRSTWRRTLRCGRGCWPGSPRLQHPQLLDLPSRGPALRLLRVRRRRFRGRHGADGRRPRDPALVGLDDADAGAARRPSRGGVVGGHGGGIPLRIDAEPGTATRGVARNLDQGVGRGGPMQTTRGHARLSRSERRLRSPRSASVSRAHRMPNRSTPASTRT